jgi:hypothetical protein
MAENIFKADEVVYLTNRARMPFAQQYLAGNAVTRWRQHCKKHPEAA